MFDVGQSQENSVCPSRQGERERMNGSVKPTW